MMNFKKILRSFINASFRAKAAASNAIQTDFTHHSIKSKFKNHGKEFSKLIDNHTESNFLIVEVDKAEPIVGDLFKRRFRTDTFPNEPRHFVAFVIQGDGSLTPLGYVHYTMWQKCALCGGLVIDERRFRKLPAPTRQLIRNSGGIAQLLLRESFSRLPVDTIAIWGHVGDLQSQKVCLRVGFEKTDRQFILVLWRMNNLLDREKEEWLDRVEAITPF